MDLKQLIVEAGFSLGLLVNALLFIPQIVTILKNKAAKEVSLITFLGFNIIQLFTLLHGLIVQDYILVIGYFLSLLSCGTVTFLIIYYNYFNKLKP